MSINRINTPAWVIFAARYQLPGIVLLALIFYIFADRLQWLLGSRWGGSWAVLDSLGDTFLLLGLVSLAHYCFRQQRLWSLLLALALLLPLALQYLVLWIGGQYLTPLALSSVDHIALLFSWGNAAKVFIVLLLFGAAGVVGVLAPPRRVVPAITAFFLALTSFAGAALIEQKYEFHVYSWQRLNNLDAAAPLRAYQALLPQSDEALGPALSGGLSGVMLRDGHAPVSIVAPAQTEAGKRLNVLLIFAEGMSARTIGAYGGAVPDLTPNIDQFARRAMVVSDYYNHTAATYRGLLGQLCGVYSGLGGAASWRELFAAGGQRSYPCLTQLFSELGYRSAFFDAHVARDAYVDELMAMIGFDSVLTAESVKHYPGVGAPKAAGSLSDQQYFDGLIGYLREHEGTDERLFMAGYNLGTHAWVDVPADELSYGDGSVNALNTIHNFDDAFGRFWQYFNGSSWADNTLLVLTSDHAHYMEESYVEALADHGDHDYRPLFIDRIPLLAYYPEKGFLPPRYNAKNNTSLGLAKTVTSLLDIPVAEGVFSGYSIFAKRPEPIGFASYGNEFYLIEQRQLYNRKSVTDARRGDYQQFMSQVRKMQQQEQADELWEPGPAVLH